MSEVEQKPIFRNLDADDPEPETTQIESLCVNCHSTGTTCLLLTKIPFYKEIVLMSFSCDECGYANNELQPGGQIPEKGISIVLKVQSAKDLNRQVVKSDFASVKFVELDFEIPAKSQRGEVTTVESIIERSILALQQDQPSRKLENAELADQIDGVTKKLEEIKLGHTTFTLELEDISGNSFIENPLVPQTDPLLKIKHFTRTKAQDHELGIYSPSEVNGNKDDAILHPIAEDEFKYEDLRGEVLTFPTNCNICKEPCDTNMTLTSIPHFKEVVIMATVCESCGNCTNEVKTGGRIEELGVRFEVDIATPKDLQRDILKADTCDLMIPQLELEVGACALSGRFTTVEGLLVSMKQQLTENIFRDSQPDETNKRLNVFLKGFDEIIEGRKPVTLILDDPAGNSYIATLNEDGTPDDSLRISRYERSFEQNDELGFNDINTENYES